MKPARLLPVVALVLASLVLAVSAFTPVSAQQPDSVTASAATVVIGEQFDLTIQLSTPAGATVEVDPASPAWGGIQVIRLLSQRSEREGDLTRHTIQLRVAAFLPGNVAIAPALFVVQEGAVTPRTVPPAAIAVATTLPADAPLELSSLGQPLPISGGESPLLRPAIALGALLLLTILGLAAYLLGRRFIGRAPAGPLVPQPANALTLQPAEALLASDPVAAYRHMAQAVRIAINTQHLPATALTTRELQQRMETHGVERWQARLVSGLLTECDAVVYAGYRPALERREADLNMARQIIGGEG